MMIPSKQVANTENLLNCVLNLCLSVFAVTSKASTYFTFSCSSACEEEPLGEAVSRRGGPNQVLPTSLMLKDQPGEENTALLRNTKFTGMVNFNCILEYLPKISFCLASSTWLEDRPAQTVTVVFFCICIYSSNDDADSFFLNAALASFLPTFHSLLVFQHHEY